MHNRIKLQQPRMQLYTVPAVKKLPVDFGPTQPADTHKRTLWGNSEGTIGWLFHSGPV